MTPTILSILTALAAGATFVGLVYPLLQRRDSHQRHEDLILRRRRDLFDAAQTQIKGERTAARTIDFSAKSNVETFFKVKRLIGSVTDGMRTNLIKAGYRQQAAPLVFILLRVGLPILFVLLGMFFLSKGKPLDDTVVLLILLSAAAAGFFLPPVLLKNQIIKRQQTINQSFPDALDMIMICVQGGISLEQAVNRIAGEMADHSAILAEELGVLGAELGLLGDRKAAFYDFANRVGSGAARSFATAMIQAEQYGTSISNALRVMADESRDMRMAEAERKAASLPPKLTVPMILFFLPALFVVILGPAAIQAAAVSVGN